jgi:serine/threonine protein phosphatase PrpC
VLSAFGISDKGQVRLANEDCFAIREELGLLVIADGMGGHNAGEVAARLAVDVIVDAVSRSVRREMESCVSLHADGDLLRSAIERANANILETAITADHYSGMGTTVVAARVNGGRLAVAHVGDSRLYLMTNGRLRQFTHDDSWIAAVLADDPDANPAMLTQHRMRNVLTNVVGARAGATVHVAETTLDGGELLLLTTDGIHGVLTDAWLERMLAVQDDLPEVAARIVDGALRRGSRDNCTAIVGRYV